MTLLAAVQDFVKWSPLSRRCRPYSDPAQIDLNLKASSITTASRLAGISSTSLTGLILEPPGSIQFYDGTTLLGAATLSSDTASYATT
jgi:hypothetical protein